ncbi:MAG: PQQ-binding-like beta-propeller repeat protein, partial [Planctomycetota bacterium]
MGRLDLEARRTTGGRSARETRASSGRRSDGARSAPSLVGLGAGALVSLALLAPARAAGKKDPAGAQAPVWATRPSLEQTYADYRPAFCTGGPESEGLKFSRQGRYLNMGDVRMDAEVRPIIDKANETAFRKKEPRKATELYRRIIEDYPGDMIQIAEQGVFVPAALYVQRKILRYPEKELDYYRVLYDPAAKEIYRRALKRYSIFDYKDLADYHLATSYGDDALFALGNNAVDKGQYDEARRYYERIVTYHGLEDTDRDAVHLDRDHVWARLAICCRHLGLEKKFRAAVGRIEDKEQPVVARLLEQLEKLEYDAFAVRQREGRRSARYDAMDDRKLSEPLPYEFSANRGEWRAALKRRPLRWQQAVEPEPLPWATETDLIYKDLNILHSRSLLTGELNWVFGPGGSSFDWDRYRSGGWASRHRVDYYPDQSILVHDGVVLAHMFVYGPSLVAVDQHTGRLLWAKGPMAATSEEEWLDRYQASPAGARGMVVAPVVHDDIRGRTHISSSAELAAFETRSGKRLWQTRLSQISPLKITQSRYPRKIRVFSTTPLVKDGVVYHVTNAGVVAAVDARTGRARWLTRYPQKKQALDNLTGPGRVWRNEPPLVHGDRLYVTPVDSPFLLCLDKDNGRILWVATRDADSTWPARGHTRFPTVWRMIGLTTEGRLCLVGRDIVFLDPETGRLVWKLGAHDMWGPRGRFIRKRVPKGLEAGITGEGKDYWTNLGSVHARPTLTRDGKMWYAMQGWYLNPFPYQGPFNSEYCLDLASREIVLQRRWYHPPCFINDHQRNPPVIKRVVNEEPEPFHPAARMCFRRWDVPFEVDVTFNHIAVRYDRDRMRKVLARRKDLNTLFAKAEVARKQGDVQGAIRQYEQCKPLLPSEEEDRRRTINLRLYPLYTELARWGHQSADYDFLEAACKKMGATASSAGQEIRALLAYAELHEKKGRWLRAVQVLQNASRHYWREPLPVSRLELGRREELIDTARKGLENLLGEIPAPYRQEGRQILRLERAALGDYFLSVANVDASYVVEARTLVAKRMRSRSSYLKSRVSISRSPKSSMR